jgi:glycine betaine/proline transport system substrate-binding protein
VFKTAESSPNAGTFLGGDPSYVQKDRALIKELGLDLKHVVAGAEPAQVARWTQLYKQKKPVIFYWYAPQYLNLTYDLVQIQLPKRFKGCVDDEKVKGKHACEYPSYRLDKVVSGKFATSGSPAVKVVKKFTWTSADQEAVSALIAGKNVPKDKAAETWVKANAAKVNAWLK